MATAPAVITERDGAVGLAQLNRPEQRNALSPELMEELAATVEGYDRDPDVRCIVIAGGQNAFASGLDARAISERGVEEALVAAGAAFWPRFTACGTPLVAAVAGYALAAGFELALACDIVIAADNAELGLPDITLGMIPGGGATQRLARTIGRQRTLELVLTGRRIDAAEALSLGIVNEVVGNRRWVARAREVAKLVASRPPLATRLAKRAVIAAEETHLPEGLAEERRLFGAAVTTEDRVEGIRAFLEGRHPRFEGQ